MTNSRVLDYRIDFADFFVQAESEDAAYELARNILKSSPMELEITDVSPQCRCQRA